MAPSSSSTATGASAVEDAPTVKLPNGLVLRHFTTDELQFLYREIYQDRVYLKHGVTLRPGDTVIDVGANTGLFTMQAAEAVGPSGRVVSLEPVPATHALLAANVASHAAWCAERGVQACTPTLLASGAGPPGQSEAVFTTYSESASGWSTMTPNDEEVRANMRSYILSLLEGRAARSGGSSSGGSGGAAAGIEDAPIPEPLLAQVGRALWRLPPLRPPLRWLAGAVVERMLGSQRTWSRPLVALGALMREQRLERVDLLKVDVERAELQVLAGLAPEDWARVRQVVMEVHDLPEAVERLPVPLGAGAGAQGVAGRSNAAAPQPAAAAPSEGPSRGQLCRVKEVLVAAGFDSIVCEQEAGLEGTSIYNLYALRS
ncbi:hypothetical protein HYH02_011904 [Chlamydomonas schloesseri]|uniref:Methyltransferase FkbM domain-containing protein n=1 Tax=Chlamydomonas schloesseri TaxID=2026947 RepID=A0A835W3E2_9CHLO|nr:hypothetical protein HYH02_011904 [Chlamydomonas schloesseri]|eukprot:KAG2435614.1 hypothetical protein HYH02_011904 [Chlamydomonas schloesseri]